MKNFSTTTLLALVLLRTFSAQAQDSLFISELIDPADDYTGRFIELYNAGSAPVDFSSTTCFLSRQSNGGTTWGDLQLAGSVAAGATFVIGGSGFEALYGFPPDQESGILIGNGDDAYALFTGGDHETGVLHDILGAIDVDGTGEAWEYTDSRALRLESVRTPNPVWTAAEWEISAASVADADPGTHLGSVPGDTIPSGSYSLTLVGDTVTPGQLASVAVNVHALSEEDGIISFQFDVDFDTSSLAYTGFTLSGTLAEGGTAVVNPGISGRLSVGYMHTDPVIGAGTIFQLQFTALVPDTTELSISNAYLNTIPVLDLGPAAVIIAETAPPTAVITYSDTVNRFADTLLITASFSEAMSAASAVRISLSGAAILPETDMTRISETVYTYLYQIPKASGEVTVTLSNGTDLWGNELVPVPLAGATFTILGFRPGDVNDDGVIQAYDAALALQYSVGIDPLPSADPRPWEAWRDSTANVDGTGGITANDAGLILQYSAGIITDFPSDSELKAAEAHVSVVLEDDHVVFYSHGELLGLNVNAEHVNGLLGSPEILQDHFLSAVNQQGGNIRIGLCSALAASDGEPLLKIPFSGAGPVTFHLIENTRERDLTLDLAAALPTPPDAGVTLYPNPVVDVLKVMGLSVSSTIRIRNIHGKELIRTDGQGEIRELDLSLIPPGIYLITVETGDAVLSRRIIKK